MAKSRIATGTALSALYQVMFPSLILMLTVKAECDMPPIITGSATNITGSPPFPEGTTVRYDCSPGYSTVGTSRFFTCNSTGWIDGVFRCEQIFCSYVPTPENGQVTNTPTREIGTDIYFACNDGYDISGSSSLLCLIDGLWSPSTPPTCTAKDCGEFENIQYANVFQDNGEFERNMYGSVAHVTCLDGKVLNGPSRVRCEANGQWGQKPTCETSQCPAYPNTNSSCTDFTKLLDVFYLIQCRGDVSSTRSGPDSAECISGVWDSLEMACFCDCSLTDDNTSVSIGNLNSRGYLPHEATLQWTCKNGAISSVNDYVICRDGTLEVVVVGGEEMAIVNLTTPSGNNRNIVSNLCVLPPTVTTRKHTTDNARNSMFTGSSSISGVTMVTDYWSKDGNTVTLSTEKNTNSTSAIFHTTVQTGCMLCCLCGLRMLVY